MMGWILRDFNIIIEVLLMTRWWVSSMRSLVRLKEAIDVGLASKFPRTKVWMAGCPLVCLRVKESNNIRHSA